MGAPTGGGGAQAEGEGEGSGLFGERQDDKNDVEVDGEMVFDEEEALSLQLLVCDSIVPSVIGKMIFSSF